jgi:hypothetical protein
MLVQSIEANKGGGLRGEGSAGGGGAGGGAGVAGALPGGLRGGCGGGLRGRGVAGGLRGRGGGACNRNPASCGLRKCRLRWEGDRKGQEGTKHRKRCGDGPNACEH